MTKNKTVQSLGRGFGKIKLKGKKYSPEILLAVGLGSLISGAIIACRASTKAHTIKENINERKNHIDMVANTPIEVSDDPTMSDILPSNKDLRMVKITAVKDTAVDILKLYGLPVVLGCAGVTCILTSYGIVKRRNAALSASYAALHTTFKEYRKRVADKYGEEAEREIMTNTIVKTGENGIQPALSNNELKNTEITSRFFDEGCLGFRRDAEANMIFLKKQEDYFNDLLQVNGYVFLNDVYDALGIPRSRVGQMVGWIYDEKNPVGDNFIDFGLYDRDSEASRRFVNGYEPVILLNFNTDGPILDYI